MQQKSTSLLDQHEGAGGRQVDIDASVVLLHYVVADPAGVAAIFGILQPKGASSNQIE